MAPYNVLDNPYLTPVVEEQDPIKGAAILPKALITLDVLLIHSCASFQFLIR